MAWRCCAPTWSSIRPTPASIPTRISTPSRPRCASTGSASPSWSTSRGNVVEAGNGTLEAARALGWTHVAAVLVDDEPATAAGFGISDNRTAELAEWDQEALDKLLASIEIVDDPELQAMLDGLKTKPDEPAGDETGKLTEQFQVLVICKNEPEQAALLTRFAAEGLECRSLIS